MTNQELWEMWVRLACRRPIGTRRQERAEEYARQYQMLAMIERGALTERQIAMALRP